MNSIKQIHYGRISIKNNAVSVKPFQFTGNRSSLPVDIRDITVSDNDIVEFTIEQNNRAIIQSVAATAGSARADIFKIIEDMQITISYPDTVMDETANILQNPAIDDPAIMDFSSLPFITIDNDGSRDLDQAMYIEKAGSVYRIYYALADCAYYIRPGSRLFDEALKRGATYYFPGFSVPMLPSQLSEGTISLNPDVDRRAFVFIMDMGPDGSVSNYSCAQARIHSRAQLTYNQVQGYYNSPYTSDLMGQEYTPVLDLLQEAGRIMIEQERHGNRVHFNRKETVIGFSNDGQTFTVNLDERNDCSRYNEQVSLLCNTIGARLLTEGEDPNVQGIYRIHEGPGHNELLELQTVIGDILHSHTVADQKWYWDMNRETLAAYLNRICSFQEDLHLVEALERQVMLAMRRSVFAEKAGPHYALAANPYSRFSSPMREIVGIFIHKEALEKLGLLKPAPIDSDIALREQVVDAGNRSKTIQHAVERAVVKCAIDRLFNDELEKPVEQRTHYAATILGAKSTRLYVRLDNPPVELKVYTQNLEAHLQRELEYAANRLMYKDSSDVAFKAGDRLVLYIQHYKKERWSLVPVE